jgi:hypothetical protein
MSATQPETKHTPHTPEPPNVHTHTHTQTHTPNPFGPEAYFKSLPDTEANRKILSRWADQDARAQRTQRHLFSLVQEPIQLPPTEPETYHFETATITLQSEDEINAPSLDTAALDRLVISKMISGSTSSQISTSETIFLDTISAVNIEKEFPAVFAHKKNHKGSVLGFVSFLKEKEYFQWPTTESGSALRGCLDRLASDLMAEYLVPPKLIAVIEIVALFQIPTKKSNLIYDFHAALSYADSEFPEFQELYSQGRSDDSVLNFKPAPLQPGFDRLVRNGSVDDWIDTAAVMIDSACFQDIGKLEQECCTALSKWKRFSIANQPPKSARVEELQLFTLLAAASERAAIPTIDHILRAQALLRSITLTIKLQGKQISVRELIRDRIAENHFGKGAVSRDLVFELYEHFYMSSGYHGVETQDKNIQPPIPEPRNTQPPTVLTTEAASTSMIPVAITCRSCQIHFEEIPGKWAAKFPGAHMPKSCKACIAARKKRVAEAETVMIVEEDELTVGAVEVDSYSEGTDYDSEEDKPWRF